MIPYKSSEYLKYWGEGMRLPGQSQGLDRWFFRWHWQDFMDQESSRGSEERECNKSGYYASYVIGTQWFDLEAGKPLVITPKRGCERIDFLTMFSTCLHSGIASESFSKIYEVNMEQPRIQAPQLKSILSPLIVVHFLSLVQEIVKKGLKKGYISREDNLKKVKGHIAIARNERSNVIKRRFDRVCCKYQEYSENTPENRLIKKALLFARQILQNASMSHSLSKLQYVVGQCLTAFCNVDENVEVWEIKSVKQHKLYRAYDEVIKLAQMILRRYDYCITNITPAAEEECPVFWIDMALLYEYYVLGLLKEAYGEQISHQAQGKTGYPDFICYDPKLIMDTKYIPRFETGSIDTYIIRQLSGYARDRGLFPIRINEIIPCLIIYPEEGKLENPFKGKSIAELLQSEEKSSWNVYRLAVPLPMLHT